MDGSVTKSIQWGNRTINVQVWYHAETKALVQKAKYISNLSDYSKEPTEHETAVSSFFNSYDVRLGVGSMLLGVIAQIIGSYQFIYYIAICVYFLYLLILFIYAKKHTLFSRRKDDLI